MLLKKKGKAGVTIEDRVDKLQGSAMTARSNMAVGGGAEGGG